MFRYLFVGGHFGEEPKTSGYISKLFSAFHAMNPNGMLMNGGNFEELVLLSNQKGRLQLYDVIFWMPDVSNEKRKLVDKIKILAPHTLLVTSKNNIEGKYILQEIIARALKVKANLFIALTRPKDGSLHNKICAGIYDPLGNCFGVSSDITDTAVTLIGRIQELLRYTRVSSEVHEVVYDWDEKKPPNISEEFFTLIRDYADVFHECIHGANKSRLLGNASFRCERGFPSFKDGDDRIYVSRRNIDKRYIGPEGFVPVRLKFNDKKKKMTIAYSGEHKPSVDTPIQLLLYHYYHNIKFMIHSHTYIEGAPFTTHCIPCGAIEEFYEIIKHKPQREHYFLELNLKGHGSLFMASSIDHLRGIEYIPRETPEWI